MNTIFISGKKFIIYINGNNHIDNRYNILKIYFKKSNNKC